MIEQLLLAFGLICATVIIHAIGTVEAIAFLVRGRQKANQKHGHMALRWRIVRVVSILLLLHFLEAAMWGASYWISGTLADFETAVYFSLTSYTTVGYGDVVLPAAWRLLGPIESAVGILMFGWSTGILVAAITRIYGDRLKPLVEQQAQDNEPPRTSG